ncbi:hypothetical protein F0562_025455 [Nyssa sinensis]|uniref:RING-type E3 ubiquitin transferase n=1 Tax=Nyssa sinensis TaxID=561372 RepID=A0A5J5BIC2_9ASTE|nr:hypothetical protein F0562_025455 [Nyssa sinensis]
MSSSGVSGGGGSGPQSYFCYQCNRTVSITPSPTSELLCPNCNGGFLEEYENPNPDPNSTPDPFVAFSSHSLSGFPSSSAGTPIVFSSAGGGGGAFELQNPSDLSALFGGLGRSATLQGPGEFNPFAFLQNYLNTLTAGGANIQFVIENNSADPGFRLPGNLGDYFNGPGLEQLIQQLAENDPNRFFPVRDYESRTLVTPSPENLSMGSGLAPFGGGSGGVGGSSQENPETQLTAERRFRISLPWPFSVFGSPAETSNSGAGNNRGNNNGESNSGAQAREEDLD